MKTGTFENATNSNNSTRFSELLAAVRFGGIFDIVCSVSQNLTETNIFGEKLPKFKERE